jgi:ferredoxin--NADP+ reductase
MNLPAAGLGSAPSPTRAFNEERVLSVHHWTEDYFSFRTTRRPDFRFENGQFVMIGLEVNGRPLMRAYSIASANWEDELEFFSIKVPDGALTSRLQHLKAGDPVLVSRKPTGTLLIHDLHPGRNLFLFGTGTGLAPWLSIIRDPATYESFEQVIVAHGVRGVADLAYRDVIERELPQHEWLGPTLARKLRYYPAVSREAFAHQGRLTTLLDSGQMLRDLGLPPLDAGQDRAMICGSPSVLDDLRALLEQRGLRASPRIGTPGDYVFERAFVEK